MHSGRQQSLEFSRHSVAVGREQAIACSAPARQDQVSCPEADLMRVGLERRIRGAIHAQKG
jgi:hypothetical protein